MASQCSSSAASQRWQWPWVLLSCTGTEMIRTTSWSPNLSVAAVTLDTVADAAAAASVATA
jgi:hypothetical protein